MSSKKTPFIVRPGTIVTGKIEGNLFIGRLQKEGGNWFVCQNVRDGSDCKHKLGFKYSWQMNHVTPKVGANSDDVVIFHMENDEKTGLAGLAKVRMGVTINGDRATVAGDGQTVQVGCTTVKFSQVEKIYEKMVELQEEVENA